MSTDKETSTDRKPKKKWLMFRRRQRMSGCGSGAAPQEAEEQRDSCAGPAAQAAAAESRAAAPHRPRARGRALLRSLRHGSRAILSRVAAVLRPRNQQPGTQRHLRPGMGAVAAATVPAAGAQSRAASRHGPCCPATASPAALGALGGQGSGAEDSSCETALGLLPPRPSPSQVEARRQWAIAAANILLAGLPSEEGDSSEDVQGSSSSSGDESAYVSCKEEAKPLVSFKGTEHLELTQQSRGQPATKGEDTKSEELSEEKSGAITIHTIWVNPRYPQLLGQPVMLLVEGAPGDLPSTSRALAAPRRAQPAAAARAGAPEHEEPPVRGTALPQEVAETAASAGPGAQAASAESRAVVLSSVAAVLQPHSSQQPGTQRHLHPGMEAVAAGAQSQAASSQGPSFPSAPSPTPLEALGGQGAGAALGAVPTAPKGQEEAWEASSPKELSQGEQEPDQSCRGGEVRPSVRPGEAGVEHSNVPPCTASGQASALPSRAPHSRAEASAPGLVPEPCPHSPSPGMLEAPRGLRLGLGSGLGLVLGLGILLGLAIWFVFMLGLGIE